MTCAGNSSDFGDSAGVQVADPYSLRCHQAVSTHLLVPSAALQNGLPAATAPIRSLPGRLCDPAAADPQLHDVTHPFVPELLSCQLQEN